MSQEISIHRSLKHQHVVEFYSYFEDTNNIYIILEICNKRSLMEMHKRRKLLTEPEVRYFVRQIALACKYLHDNKVVHRDLKLGNLFINDDMHVKVGDFGLATRVGNGERKLTLCGTPNYIAPEVLTKKGHSFEVDVWSLGCIVYTLLVGHPPFETDDLKKTYQKIRHNDYKYDEHVHVPHEARLFIDKMLQADPSKRPNMNQILDDPYLMKNYIPRRIPTSCLTTHPRFDQGRLSIMPTEFGSPRRAFTPRENVVTGPSVPAVGAVKPNPLAPIASGKGNPPISAVNSPLKSSSSAPPSANHNPSAAPDSAAANMAPIIPHNSDNNDLVELQNQIKSVVATLSSKRKFQLVSMGDDAMDPAAMPIFWISKWVDYTEKYGMGYELCDNSIGVLFNDLTRIVMMADEETIQYIERNGEEQFFNRNTEKPPRGSHLFKKATLLQYFKNYMSEHLVKTGEKAPEADEMARLPYLQNWFRTKSAIIFQLTNGTVQINFFEDHIKLILCPHMAAVTVVNTSREFQTYRFDLIAQHGATQDLFARLKYAGDIVGKLLTHKLTTPRK